MKKPELKVAGPQKLDNGDYSKQLEHMHVELNDLAKWLQHTRERLAVVIEGCHTAGKGGAIGALSDELNPRQFHTVALSKPGGDMPQALAKLTECHGLAIRATTGT